MFEAVDAARYLENAEESSISQRERERERESL